MAAVWDPYGSIFVMATALSSLAGGVAIGDKDVVLLKLDASGNQEWVSQLGTRFSAAFQHSDDEQNMAAGRASKHVGGTVERVSCICIYLYIYIIFIFITYSSSSFNGISFHKNAR